MKKIAIIFFGTLFALLLLILIIAFFTVKPSDEYINKNKKIETNQPDYKDPNDIVFSFYPDIYFEGKSDDTLNETDSKMFLDFMVSNIGRYSLIDDIPMSPKDNTLIWETSLKYCFLKGNYSETPEGYSFTLDDITKAAYILYKVKDFKFEGNEEYTKKDGSYMALANNKIFIDRVTPDQIVTTSISDFSVDKNAASFTYSVTHLFTDELYTKNNYTNDYKIQLIKINDEIIINSVE